MIENRIEILIKLKDYLLSGAPEWIEIKEKAQRQNGWFTQEFIDLSIRNICTYYLNEVDLKKFAEQFQCAESKGVQYSIGIVMAGNIPLVGFHDFLCVFLSGHKQVIKFSSKDDVLLPHCIQKMYTWDESLRFRISSSEMLKGCAAYIATGSSNTAKYFDYYFSKYPHIIRKNRTSVAILTGNETNEELIHLSDDVYHYFGLGCRNVTKIYVPKDYDFVPLLNAFKKYDHLKHHNKYRNNFDYNLALYILNNQFYMSNESILMVENTSVFSPISVLNYQYYNKETEVMESLENNPDIQLISGTSYIPFGKAQTPSLTDFADGVNTIEFLNSL